VLSRENETLALIPVMEVRSRLTGARGVSMPFSDFCEPLFFHEAAQEIALAALLDLGSDRDWKYVEFRGGVESIAPISTAPPSCYVHILDLQSSVDTLFANCAGSVRRALRKAEKAGLRVIINSSLSAVAEFYRLHCRTRRRHGLPPQPWRFFERIHQGILAPGNGFVVLVTQEQAPVAAAVFLRWGDKAVFKFGASEAEFQELRPSNLMMWEGIKFLAGQGATSLHFGRTDVGHEGLRRFKLGWGTEEQSIRYGRFDVRRGRWSVPQPRTSGFHNHLFRGIPLFLDRLAGAVMYPHLD
jgi:CelD/BcsL family acetyltransferase involved in cellulose biosynthesis